jgi:hypothetical protein
MTPAVADDLKLIRQKIQRAHVALKANDLKRLAFELDEAERATKLLTDSLKEADRGH